MIAIEVTPLQYMLAIVSGILVGFSLWLIGGGGSILAVPLLLYLVDLASIPSTYANNYTLAQEYVNFVDHLALGTTTLAVGLNACINSYMHFRRGNVKVKEGIIFAIPGAMSALLGAYTSHVTPGQLLLFFFGILMIVVASLMLKSQNQEKVNGSSLISVNRNNSSAKHN